MRSAFPLIQDPVGAHRQQPSFPGPHSHPPLKGQGYLGGARTTQLPPIRDGRKERRNSPLAWLTNSGVPSRNSPPGGNDTKTRPRGVRSGQRRKVSPMAGTAKGQWPDRRVALRKTDCRGGSLFSPISFSPRAFISLRFGSEAEKAPETRPACTRCRRSSFSPPSPCCTVPRGESA